MNWITKKAVGNVLASWELWHDGIKLCEILMFYKGIYTLPTGIFPRRTSLQAQRTKSLEKAKSKCEKWFYDFAKSIVSTKQLSIPLINKK